MPQKVKVTTEDGNSVILTLADDAPPPKAEAPSGQGIGAGLLAGGTMTPILANAGSAFAASPTAAASGSALARGATTLGALGHGMYNGNLGQILAAPMEGWAAGKGGYWLTKGLQKIAAPVASGLQKIAPYAQGASTLGAAQGGLDLAQMAEPNRKDIGFLGMGPSVDVPGSPKPPNVSALWQALVDRLSPK